MAGLSRQDIEHLLELLNDELSQIPETGEVYLVGGAVMCLVFKARGSTKDLDAVFAPTRHVREAAARVAVRAGLEEGWLNDAVKGFLSPSATFSPHLELTHLKVFCADARYLLAMKCLAMRIGEEFQDEADVRYLLRHLNIERYDQALAVISEYYPRERFPQKAFYALAEIL